MVAFQPFNIFTPSPILGYGFDEEEFWKTIEQHHPEAIIIDAGSTDPGPYMLGTGKTLCSLISYRRDLRPVLKSCSETGLKVIISSAGGAGTNEQVDILVQVVCELADELGQSFKIATIKFNEDRVAFKSQYHAGNIRPCSSSPPLMEQDIAKATSIVAQMGAEPFLKALQSGVDVIVSGRSYDPAPFAAYCMFRGVKIDPAWHVGKIIECGGLCTTPKGRSIVATLLEDGFILTPTKPGDRCTPLSVAAHTLYEKTRPDNLAGPGGVLHIDKCMYTQLQDNCSTLVRGSNFVPSKTYEVKLEGAEQVGFRAVYIGGIRDPTLISGIDKFLLFVRQRTQQAFPALGTQDGPQLIFHVYGKNAVMGELERAPGTMHEIGVLGEVVAQTQHDADALAAFSRTMLLHGEYEGQVATAGNLASPLTPLEASIGPVFKFNIYHLMKVNDPCGLFPIANFTVGRGPTPPMLRPWTVAVDLTPAKEIEGLTLTSRRPTEPKFISELAQVIRSKNSGPFEVTLDIIFANQQDFERVEASNILTAELITKLYRLQSNAIIVCMFFRPALAWKCTFRRPWAQGSVGERDTFGAQLHAPLLSIEIPAPCGLQAKL